MERQGKQDDDEPRRKQKSNEGSSGEKKSFFIKIPSYQDVFGDAGAGGAGTASSSNTSFSEAFSFIKASEFYTPPPPLPPPERTTRHGIAPHEDPSVVGPSSSSYVSSSSSTPLTVQNRNAIIVSHRQKGNPLLKHIRNVRWVFADVVCDYLLGQSSCALYLSLRYHLLHPDYLYYRIRELQKNFKLRVVLCHVDVEDVVKPLLEVTRTALLHDCTLLCGWSLEECGRYLETLRIYENKSADSLREQTDTDYLSRLTHALTTIRHVNKTDAVTLGSTFGSLLHIMDASMEDLARCPGIGERKVKRLYDTFHEPFRRVSSQPAVPSEVPVKQKDAEIPLAAEGVEDGKEMADSPKHGKEPSVTVKSALTAAFAKYSDMIRKQETKNRSVEQGEGTDAASADAEMQ